MLLLLFFKCILRCKDFLHKFPIVLIDTGFYKKKKKKLKHICLNLKKLNLNNIIIFFMICKNVHPDIVIKKKKKSINY